MEFLADSTAPDSWLPWIFAVAVIAFAISMVNARRDRRSEGEDERTSTGQDQAPHQHREYADAHGRHRRH